MAEATDNSVHGATGWPRQGKAFTRLVFAVLGLFLVVTALLKLQGSADGALGQNTILFSPRLGFAVMEAETLLGLWLLSGWARRAAWLFAVAFFLGVTGFSLYLGVMGQSSCGCFGRLHVSPWNALMVGLACLVVLGFCWPSLRIRGELPAYPRWRHEALAITCGTGTILGLCLVFILLVGGSRPGDFLARMRGEQISVEPTMTDVGSGAVGQIRRFTVQLHNHTDRSVTIMGGTANCACIAIEDLPVTIAAGSSVSVTVAASFKGTAGSFQQEFDFYTDENDQNRVLARFKGWIIESPN